MSGYLFVYTCMHVTCSNKILDNEPVTTSPMNTRACYIGTSKKQDGSRQCRQHVHVREKRYSLECEEKKHSEITGQRPCCGCASTSRAVCETKFQGELSTSFWGGYSERHRAAAAGGLAAQPNFLVTSYRSVFL
jgi:hypothetical protein